MAGGNRKIGCIIRSYYLTDYLERVIKNYAWVDKIVIANFMFQNHPDGKKGVPIADDKTEEIVKRFSFPIVLLKDFSE